MDFQLDPSFVENIRKRARTRLVKACADTVRYIQTVKLAKGRRGQGDFLTAGDSPYSWTGHGRQSVMTRAKEGDPNTQQIGSPLFYMAVQEKGANVHGKGFMTIPRSDEAIRHLKGGGTARTFTRKMVMVPSRKRSGIFYLVEARRGGKKNAARTVVHFILARNVRIPPHPWLVPGVRENAPRMMQIMAEGG